MSGIDGASGFIPLIPISTNPSCIEAKSVSFEDIESLLLSPFETNEDVGAKNIPSKGPPIIERRIHVHTESAKSEKRCYKDFLRKLAIDGIIYIL